MKPLPPPYVPGDTDAERMDNAARKMFSVSKEEVLRREASMKRAHARKEEGEEIRLTRNIPLTLAQAPYG